MTKESLFASEQSGPRKGPRPLRIVVADDDRDAVLTLMIVLRHEGHEVLGVHSGPQVLSALDRFQADAIVLDISMPGISGWEIARNVKERYGAKRGPLLIGISGKYKETADRLASQAAGFDHYLVKPCEPSDVLRLLAPLRYQQAGEG